MSSTVSGVADGVLKRNESKFIVNFIDKIFIKLGFSSRVTMSQHLKISISIPLALLANVSL